jgi:hypothetical protein
MSLVSAFDPSSITTAPVKLLPHEYGPVEPFIGKMPGLLVSPKADLMVTSFGLTDDGRMTYIVVNRGKTPANSAFVVDLTIDGQPKDSVKHNALPALSQQRVISNLARPEVCSAVMLGIAIDTQQLVSEADETNNTQLRQLVPPCPDLVVDIDKVSNGLQYRPKMQVTNRGNLTTKHSFEVLVLHGGKDQPLSELLLLKRERMGPLAPGQTVSFYGDDYLLGINVHTYEVRADTLNEIRESNENNNVKQETMGGGY